MLSPTKIARQHRTQTCPATASSSVADVRLAQPQAIRPRIRASDAPARAGCGGTACRFPADTRRRSGRASDPTARPSDLRDLILQTWRVRAACSSGSLAPRRRVDPPNRAGVPARAAEGGADDEAWIVTDGTKSGVMGSSARRCARPTCRCRASASAVGRGEGFESLEATRRRWRTTTVLGIAGGGGSAADGGKASSRPVPLALYPVRRRHAARRRTTRGQCRQDFEEACATTAATSTLHDAGLAVRPRADGPGRQSDRGDASWVCRLEPGAVQVGVEAPRSGSPCPHEPAAYSYQDHSHERGSSTATRRTSRRS